MADRYSPVTLRLNGGPSVVKCASNRKYAVVQLVARAPGAEGRGTGNYRPKVLFRSDSPRAIAERVRRLGGFSWVFELKHGEQLWSNSSSEWMACETAVANHDTKEV